MALSCIVHGGKLGGGRVERAPVRLILSSEASKVLDRTFRNATSGRLLGSLGYDPGC